MLELTFYKMNDLSIALRIKAGEPLSRYKSQGKQKATGAKILVATQVRS